MLHLLLAAQLAGARVAAPPADSVYATPALRELIAGAASKNRTVPPGLDAYGARLESEISLLARRPDGLEGAVSIEQVENDVRWSRPGEFEQHVIGYRSQSLGLQLSVMGFFRQSWVVPMLYGNRIGLFFGGRGGPARGRGGGGRGGGGAPPRGGFERPVSYAVHPLAADRERIYRYSGGDTVATLTVGTPEGGERVIPIVRVLVEPRNPDAPQSLLFRGEMDLDAVHLEIVRLRGHFLTFRAKPSIGAKLLGAMVEAVAYVELVNAEIEGRYWLPSYQRVEGQAAVPFAGDGRSIFRIVSRFRDYRINGASALANRVESDTFTLRMLPHRLTYAPRDSIDAFSGWRRDIGEATSEVHADDFADVAPDTWRPTGPARFEVRAENPSDLFRFNRIEGAYTGLGARLRMRDAAPGVTVSGTAGWAWAEGTARGRIDAEWKRGAWIYGARAGRSLDLTNDFRGVLDSGSTLAALLGGQDQYDYVDRRSATLRATHLLGVHGDARVRFEAGVASDAGASPHASGGLFTVDSGFRPNRGVTPGRYVRTAATLEYHPNVSAEFLETGLGALLRYERGDGDLDWQRVEARLLARRTWNSFTLATRLDAGAVLGHTPPPQQLFELGMNQDLPGYDYKEFAGDRAAVGHVFAMYGLPLLRAPYRLRQRIFLPAPAPSLAVGVHSGWADLSSDGARRAATLLVTGAELGPLASSRTAPLAVPQATDGIRTTVDLSLRFFGGGVGFGVARAIDHAAKWKAMLTFGTGF